MTLLLYLLLFAFILIETPLVFMIVYLFRHRSENGSIRELREVILTVLLANFFFVFAQIVLVLSALVKFDGSANIVVYLYSISTLSVCLVNWWSLFKIKKLI